MTFFVVSKVNITIAQRHEKNAEIQIAYTYPHVTSNTNPGINPPRAIPKLAARICQP